MPTITTSVVVPLDLEDTWDVFFGDELRTFVSLSEAVVAVEDYQMRPDGTPRYTMVHRNGPATSRSVSDYTVYERPHRTVNRVVGGAVGGWYHIDHSPVEGGTRVTHRWEATGVTPVTRMLLPVLARLIRRTQQRDFDRVARKLRERVAAG